MPHQCLGCGKAFQNGSMELLKGCPGCKGTRFFYTETVLDDSARQAKAQEVSTDLRSVIDALAREDKLDARDVLASRRFDDWLAVRPPAEAPPPAPAHAEHAPAAPPAPAPLETPALMASGRDEPRAVGTVTVQEPGVYALDVERLLASQPIVIEKEGVFLIHLASAFEAPREGGTPGRRKRA